jgi:hypothetical protein
MDAGVAAARAEVEAGDLVVGDGHTGRRKRGVGRAVEKPGGAISQ